VDGEPPLFSLLPPSFFFFFFFEEEYPEDHDWLRGKGLQNVTPPQDEIRPSRQCRKVSRRVYGKIYAGSKFPLLPPLFPLLHRAVPEAMDQEIEG